MSSSRLDCVATCAIRFVCWYLCMPPLLFFVVYFLAHILFLNKFFYLFAYFDALFLSSSFYIFTLYQWPVLVRAFVVNRLASAALPSSQALTIAFNCALIDSLLLCFVDSSYSPFYFIICIFFIIFLYFRFYFKHFIPFHKSRSAQLLSLRFYSLLLGAGELTFFTFTRLLFGFFIVVWMLQSLSHVFGASTATYM